MNGSTAANASLVDGIHRGIDVGVGGGEDPDGRGLQQGHFGQKLGSGLIGHALICDHHSDVVLVLAKALESFHAIFGEDHSERLAEEFGKIFAGFLFVIDEENDVLTEVDCG